MKPRRHRKNRLTTDIAVIAAALRAQAEAEMRREIELRGDRRTCCALAGEPIPRELAQEFDQEAARRYWADRTRALRMPGRHVLAPAEAKRIGTVWNPKATDVDDCPEERAIKRKLRAQAELPIPPDLSEDNDPPAPLGRCRDAVLALEALCAGDLRDAALTSGVARGMERAAGVTRLANWKWRIAEEHVAEGRAGMAAVAAFEAGRAVGECWLALHTAAADHAYRAAVRRTTQAAGRWDAACRAGVVAERKATAGGMSPKKARGCGIEAARGAIGTEPPPDRKTVIRHYSAWLKRHPNTFR